MENCNSREMVFWLVVFAIVFQNNAGANGQSDRGFVSIDCGLSGHSSYEDTSSKLKYSSDAQFIDTGTNQNISERYAEPTLALQYLNVRSFDTGARNCYTIKSLVSGLQYLVRATFMYGNYDGLNKDVAFDLYIGVNYWKRVEISNPSSMTIAEVIFVSPVDYIHVCLLNVGLGTPFISSLELRPLKNSLYPSVNSNQSLSLVWRQNLGPEETTIIRYPDDPYDRMWEQRSNVLDWTEINTTSHVDNVGSYFEPPSAVMQRAATPVNSSVLKFYWYVDPLYQDPQYLANFHFSELMQFTADQKREFNLTIEYKNKRLEWEPFSPAYLSSKAMYMNEPIHGVERYNVLLTATGNSSLPPILNAVELFIVLPVSDIPADSGDVSALNAIKSYYQIKRNWIGDPCAPRTYAWDGLYCSYVLSGSPRITVLSLPSSGLTGEITNLFVNLTALQILDLSHNNLTGLIPDALSGLPSLALLDLTGNQLSGSIPPALLKRSQDGSLVLRVEDNPNLCFNGTSCNEMKKKSNISKIVAAIIVVVVVVMILAAVGALLIYKSKRRSGSIQLENRQFTSEELKEMTNNFQQEIGQGGFATVYNGWMVQRSQKTQVAVKKIKESSEKRVDEFMSEVQHLTRIHHKNLVSLLGYCKDENCLAMVLEYMPEGTLHDQLKGKARQVRPLSWRDRIRIAHESAKGLEYLHNGCNPPLIHRDVKSTNILLNEKLEAKLADFGISKAFGSNTDTHLTTKVAGTPGYLDPEYHMTGQLNIKSDVYSFGVVLLEIITGQDAIIQGSGKDNRSTNIIRWVQEELTSGSIEIESVVDARMPGEYQVNSVREVADLALKCTAQNSIQRPTMTEVLTQLEECITTNERKHYTADSTSEMELPIRGFHPLAAR